MEKAESRYFRLLSRLQQGKKSYEYLYDEVIKAKDIGDYDETQIRKKLDKEGKVPARNFSATKNYLFDTLLRSMRLLNENTNVDGRIIKWQQEAQLLYNRGIWSKSLERLNEAKKLAEKYQRFTLLLDILNLEINLTFMYPPQGDSLEERMARLSEEKEAAIEGLAKENEYTKARNQLFVLYLSRSVSLREQDIKLLGELKETPALKAPGRFLSFQSELLYHQSWGLIHRLQGVNLQPMRSHFKKMLDVWEKYPHFLKESPRQYKLAIFNYLSACHNAKDYSEFEGFLEKALDVESMSIIERVSDFHDYYHYKLLFLLNTGKYEAAWQLASELEEKIADYNRRRYPLRKNKLLALYHNIAMLLFVTEQYSEAAKWSKKIRKELRDATIRIDIQYFSRVLQLIIMFEREEDDKLDSRTPYLMKLLKADEMLLEFDETVLRYIRKLSRSRIPYKDREIYGAFLEDIEALESKLKMTCGQKEVKLWVRSKLTGRAMADLLREETA